MGNSSDKSPERIRTSANYQQSQYTKSEPTRNYSSQLPRKPQGDTEESHHTIDSYSSQKFAYPPGSAQNTGVRSGASFTPIYPGSSQGSRMSQGDTFQSHNTFQPVVMKPVASLESARPGSSQPSLSVQAGSVTRSIPASSSQVPSYSTSPPAFQRPLQQPSTTYAYSSAQRSAEVAQPTSVPQVVRFVPTQPTGVPQSVRSVPAQSLPVSGKPAFPSSQTPVIVHPLATSQQHKTSGWPQPTVISSPQRVESRERVQENPPLQLDLQRQVNQIMKRYFYFNCAMRSGEKFVYSIYHQGGGSSADITIVNNLLKMKAKFEVVYSPHSTDEYKDDFAHYHDMRSSSQTEVAAVFNFDQQAQTGFLLAKYPCATEIRFYEEYNPQVNSLQARTPAAQPNTVPQTTRPVSAQPTAVPQIARPAQPAAVPQTTRPVLAQQFPATGQTASPSPLNPVTANPLVPNFSRSQLTDIKHAPVSSAEQFMTPPRALLQTGQPVVVPPAQPPQHAAQRVHRAAPVASSSIPYRFDDLDAYKEHFLRLLDLERNNEATTFSPRLQGSRLVCTGARGKKFEYNLTVRSVEEFNFGDQFLLIYEDSDEHEREAVHIHDVDEGTKTIKLLAKYSDGKRVEYFQSLPHRRMVTKLESLSEEHPLIRLILGDFFESNETQRFFKYIPSERIDECQTDAISTALNSKITLIHGPPGSGKTSVAAELIEKLARKDGKILVCAPSNVATDNLAIRLKEKKMNVLRFYSKGSEKKTNIADKFAFHSYVHSLACMFYPEHTARLLQLPNVCRNSVKVVIGEEAIVAIEKQVLDTHQIICSTCSASADAILNNFKFDTVLIDEAAFCNEPEAMIPIAAGCNRIILVGDPQQLRPIIMSDEAKAAGLEISLFERLEKTIAPKMLAKQYRMHPTISYYPRNQFYGGKLTDGIDASARDLTKYTVSALFERSPVLFVHVEGTDEFYPNTTSRSNPKEAEVLISILHKMKTLQVHLNSIGVVTPYEGQRLTLVKLAEQNLGLAPGDVEIKNVDGYQGREKDFILMSCVRSKSRKIGFLKNQNRINVALTRAKYGLIVVGDEHTLSLDTNWGGFINYVKLHGHMLTEDEIEKLAEDAKGKEKFGYT